MDNLTTKPISYRIRRKAQCVATKIFGYTNMSKVYYKIVMHRKLNLKNPQTFNEKIQWLKLFYFPKDPLAIKAADKYLSREYVAEKGFADNLVKIYGAWDKAEDIDWDKIPDRFAIKCNHGCGYNIVCDKKEDLDISKANKQLNKWLKEDFSLFNCEPHYAKVPRKITCEEYIETSAGLFPIDYKIYCFNGKPAFIGVFCDRADELRRVFFDTNWNPLPYTDDDKDVDIERPQTLDTMLNMADVLCKDFPFVRVDLYEMDDKVLFGELTFTPTAGMGSFFTAEADGKIGKMLNIDKLVKEKSR